jgi:hypothetical protein
MADDFQPEPVASFRSEGLTRYFFGNREKFAVECELQDCQRDPWGSPEPFGSFWLWVTGRPIGNTHVSEQLVHAFGTLAALAQRSGDRPDSRFKALSNVDKLDLIIWARFGEDDEFDTKRCASEDRDRLRREDLRRYEVIPRGDSPWCDDWEGILVEQEDTETFIWRRWIGDVADVHDASLPRGTFAGIATKSCNWFDLIRNERVGSRREQA